MDTYPVYLAQEKIGTAEVMRQGLYYRIRCLCDLSGSVPVRVQVLGENEADLGLCVPMGNRFGLESCIPIKRIGQGKLQFTAVAKHCKTEQIAAISPEEPFGYIARLKDAYLIKREQTVGICFRSTDQFPDPQGSGQNP